MSSDGDRKKMTYKEAWERYCSVSDWREAGQHVDWAYEIEADTVYIYLQGSDEKIDWKRDFMLKPRRWVYGLWMHKGFSTMVDELYNDKDFRDVLKQNEYLERLVLIGHSCGGAMAIFIAMLESWWCAEAINAYTFGAPSMFWLRSASNKVKELGDINIVNVKLNRDIIPKLLLPFGYRKNPGEDVILKSPYRSFTKSHLPAAYSEAIKKVIAK